MAKIREVIFGADLPEFLCLGRNGFIRGKGVQLSPMGDCLFLEPITSKGEVGRCRIVVPLEGGLDGLIAELCKLRNEVRREKLEKGGQVALAIETPPEP
jgi:hypothetical protein